jgi:hypothetical protein
VLGAGLALASAVAVPASADVARYQFTTLTLNVTSVNDNVAYAHGYVFHYNPCTDTWTTTTAWHNASTALTETVSDVTVTGTPSDPTSVSLHSVYDNNGYTYSPTFDLASDGRLSLDSSAVGTGGANSAAGTWSASTTSYNHGEYVASSIGDYGPDATSCIGMPVVSNGKSG